MLRRLRNLWVLLLAFPLAGCANSRFWKDVTPQPKKKVKIDAEWSSENPSEELRRAMLDRKQTTTPDNPSVGTSPPSPLRADAGVAAPVPSSSPSAVVAPTDRTVFQHDLPQQPISAGSDIAFTVGSTAFLATIIEERQPLERSSVADVVPAVYAVNLPPSPHDIATKEPARTNRETKARDPPPEIESSEIRPPRQAAGMVRLSGVIEDSQGQAMALLDIKGQGTAYARAGDSLDVLVDGRPTTVRVVKVAVHAVSVQFGSDPTILVLR